MKDNNGKPPKEVAATVTANFLLGIFTGIAKLGKYYLAPIFERKDNVIRAQPFCMS